jgi:intracellular multiplication protein IcmO
MSTVRTHFEHREVVRDVRPLGKRIADSFMSDGVWMVLALMAASLVLFPGLTVLVLIAAPLLFWYGQVQVKKYGWPLKAPIYLGVEDPADLNPVNGQMRKGEGIFLLGWERISGRPLWLTNSDLRAHLYLIGVSGAGKTETLMGFVWNALVQGSGMILIDGKGEIVIPSRVIAMARAFLREDDVLIVNFQTGGKDRVVADKRRTSNIANLLALGASTELSEMMTALLDSGPNTDQMWLGRTESLIKALMPSLVWLRDHADEPLSPSRFRAAVELREVLKIYRDERIPWRVRAGLEGYLKTLPGGIPKTQSGPMSAEDIEAMKASYRQMLNAAPPPGVTEAQYQHFKAKAQAELQALEQGQQPTQDANEATREEQHGYVIMQLTKSLGIMADIYWYITDSSYTEIDWVDVALNRRIVIVLLPTLGLSKQGAESLGKIVTASVKAMMNRVLGDTVERRAGDPRFKTLTQGNHPFYIIFDEKPAYIVDGEDVIATQARSLGFSVSYGAQAHSHMLEKNAETAKAIAGAATRTKIIAGVEDYDTMDMAIKLGGEVWKPVQNAYEYNLQSEFGGIRAGPTISVQKEALVNLEELKSQKEGQAHVFMALQRKTGEIQRVIKANMIYVVPKEPDAVHIQHLVPNIQPDRLKWSPLQKQHPITGAVLETQPTTAVQETAATATTGAAASGGGAKPAATASHVSASGTGDGKGATAATSTEEHPMGKAINYEEIFARANPNMQMFLEEIDTNAPDQANKDAAYAMVDRLQAVYDGIAAKLPLLADPEGVELFKDIYQSVNPQHPNGGGHA